jgi:hypothetical protein
MRYLALIAVVAIATVGFAQESESAPVLVRPRDMSKVAQVSAANQDLKPYIVPAGTKVPLRLQSGISTKTARVGDSVYAQTQFPVAIDNKMMIPAGTYVQGKISKITRPGRVKGRAEVLFNFTTLVYPSGYTVTLPGSVDTVDSEKAATKDAEGTIQQSGEKGKDIGTVASTGATGAIIGAAAGGGKGAGIGAGIGGATGLAITMLSRGSDVHLPAGTTVEMVINRELELDPTRIGGPGFAFPRGSFRPVQRY